MIRAEIVADSLNEFGNRITTVVCEFPRWILSELNTHRVFSRNSASSRAVPFNTMLDRVTKDPCIPIAWQKEHKGMQGTEYITNGDRNGEFWCREQWMLARDHAIKVATDLSTFGPVTKQLCNRLLEPFMWHVAIITSTEWENFFELRCPKYIIHTNDSDGRKAEHLFKSKKDLLKSIEGFPNIHAKVKERSTIDWLLENKGQGEVHIMALAEAIYDARNESTPKQLKAGEWHIPFGDNIDWSRAMATCLTGPQIHILDGRFPTELAIKIATARCARVSYINYEGKDDYEADIKLYDTLLKNGHASPLEHCAKAMSTEDMDNFFRAEGDKGIDLGWCRNFKGFMSQRFLVEEK